VGLGLDLVEHYRIARLLTRYSRHFIDRIMDSEEAAALSPEGPALTTEVAIAVALKEAASKAIGTGWSRGVFWRDIRVETRTPYRIDFLREAGRRAERCGSSGRTAARVGRHGELILAEVWLLACENESSNHPPA
jgi:holo-[acyl-carrier protein] synthase